jgi:hypothetical protein
VNAQSVLNPPRGYEIHLIGEEVTALLFTQSNALIDIGRSHSFVQIAMTTFRADREPVEEVSRPALFPDYFPE